MELFFNWLCGRIGRKRGTALLFGHVEALADIIVVSVRLGSAGAAGQEVRYTFYVSPRWRRSAKYCGMSPIAKSAKVSLLGGLEFSIEMSDEAKRAAWALYVELNTRILIEDFEVGEGSVREALNSIYSVFEVTREVLKAAGVEACRARKGYESLGWLAMNMLNHVIRPRLVIWHSSLSKHEAETWKSWLKTGRSLPDSRELALSIVDESAWEGYETFDEDLEDLQKSLRIYVEIFGALAEVLESERVTLL